MEFQIAPASSAVTLVLGGLAAVMLVLAALLVWLTLLASRASVTVDAGSLKLKLPLYGRSIPVESLALDRAKITRIDEGSALRAVFKTNGIGLPGYQLGWFRLKNGEKALVAVTAKQKVLYLPTREDYALLLSVKNPSDLLDRLRSRVP